MSRFRSQASTEIDRAVASAPGSAAGVDVVDGGSAPRHADRPRRCRARPSRRTRLAQCARLRGADLLRRNRAHARMVPPPLRRLRRQAARHKYSGQRIIRRQPHRAGTLRRGRRHHSMERRAGGGRLVCGARTRGRQRRGAETVGAGSLGRAAIRRTVHRGGPAARTGQRHAGRCRGRRGAGSPSRNPQDPLHRWGCDRTSCARGGRRQPDPGGGRTGRQVRQRHLRRRGSRRGGGDVGASRPTDAVRAELCLRKSGTGARVGVRRLSGEVPRHGRCREGR